MPHTVHLAESDADIRRCYPVMHELRPHIASADDLLARVRRMQAQAGWRLIYIEDAGEPVAVAGFRILDYTSIPAARSTSTISSRAKATAAPASPKH